MAADESGGGARDQSCVRGDRKSRTCSPVVCVHHTLCNGLLPGGSGGCKSGGCKSGGKSGKSGSLAASLASLAVWRQVWRL